MALAKKAMQIQGDHEVKNQCLGSVVGSATTPPSAPLTQRGQFHPLPISFSLLMSPVDQKWCREHYIWIWSFTNTAQGTVHCYCHFYKLSVLLQFFFSCPVLVQGWSHAQFRVLYKGGRPGIPTAHPSKHFAEEVFNSWWMWYSDMCKYTLRTHQIYSQSSSFKSFSGGACPQTP